ncbi:MAG: O-methyltransferase [Proteiniphilum sp.]|nr:O-methyltransferase [Proteiniphilum sp.]
MDKIEEYILSHIDAEPELLKKIDRDAHVRLLQGNMNSGHLQGRFLKMITQMIRPKRVLEVGTFVGYSALCFAEGLDGDGEIHTIEIDDELEERIRYNFALSEYENKIRLYIGDAIYIIPCFPNEYFDLAFIDAGKEAYRDYYEATLPKIKKGGVMLVDNTLWYGKVVEKVRNADWATQGILAFNRELADDDRVEKVIVPLRDGLTLIRKK